MENRNNILKELREVSPVVADISHQVPYKVPTGYFEGLAHQLLQLVKTSNPVLPKANNPYQVPQGYFEGLANTILQRAKADDNTSLSPALQQAKENPYQVPQGYFENLPAAILNRLKATVADNATDELEILSPVLSQLSKQMPFSTPAGYFEELGENAVAGAQAIDFVNGALENLPPLLNDLKTVQVYEVPAGYFEQLPGQVLNAVKAQQPAKVVSMHFTRRVIRYAAAAVVAGLIITAGWFFLSNNKGGKLPPDQIAQLDSISDDVLQKYLENQTPTPAETALAATTAVEEMDANDMKDMLADVTDEDLQQYLEKYSTVKNTQTN
jgi:hypothetical protein